MSAIKRATRTSFRKILKVMLLIRTHLYPSLEKFRARQAANKISAFSFSLSQSRSRWDMAGDASIDWETRPGQFNTFLYFDERSCKMLKFRRKVVPDCSPAIWTLIWLGGMSTATLEARAAKPEPNWTIRDSCTKTIMASPSASLFESVEFQVPFG